MAVKIKLTRLGKIRNPQYRIAVADGRTRRDGRSIEVIGRYHPKEDPSLIEINSERAQYWLSVGAQPTEPVLKLLKITGDWQKFKGLPGAEGRLKVAPPKPSKLELFNAALAAADGGPTTEAAKPKKKAAANKAAKAAAPEAAAEVAPEPVKTVAPEVEKTEVAPEVVKTEVAPEVEKTDVPVETTEVPVETAVAPVETAEVPVETAEVPVETIVETAEVPVETIVETTDVPVETTEAPASAMVVLDETSDASAETIVVLDEPGTES